MTGKVSLVTLMTLVFIGPIPCWAQQGNAAPQVQVQVESHRVTVGVPFWARVTVTSGEGGASVSLPPGSPFELLSRGGTSSSFQMSTSFGGGMQVIRQESFRWQLRVLRPGRHTLGPLIVNAGGRQHRVGSTVIEAVAGASGATPSPSGGLPPSTMSGVPVPTPSMPVTPGQQGVLAGQIEPDALSGATYDPELFIRTVLDPEEAWVGQQVIVTVYIYTTLQLANVNVTREASTDGFWSEDLLGPSRRLRFEDQFIGQNHFRVALLRRVALFPLRDGTLTVGAPQLEATTALRSLFSRRAGTIARAGVPVELRVRRLPTADRPAAFHSGNVGRYDITSHVDRRRVKVGEPVTLTLSVKGRGHLRNVKLPPLGELAGARVYEPRVEDSVGAQGGNLGGERRWEYLIMPQQPGTLEIPAVKLAYFDPDNSRYQSKLSKAVTIEVTGTPSSTTPVSSDSSDGGSPGESVETSELGPLHSIRRQSALSTTQAPTYGRWWFFLILIVAPAGFVTFVVVQRLKHHRLATRDVVRSRRAAQAARAALDEAASSPGSDGLAGVMRAINVFFQDRFGQSATGHTMDELRAFLLERGAAEDLANRAADLMERCERGRFGGDAGDGADLDGDARALIAELDELEASPRKGK